MHGSDSPENGKREIGTFNLFYILYIVLCLRLLS